MIDTIATRRTTFNGKTYAKGDKVPMPLQQFQDLEPTGLFERATTEKKAAAVTKPAKARTKAAPKAPAPASAPVQPVETTSSTPAD